MLKERIRKNFRLFRIENGLSQADIAEALGVSVMLVCGVETARYSGKRAFWKLLKLTYKLSESEIEKMKEIEA